MMETFEQKVERMAIVMWLALDPSYQRLRTADNWHRQGSHCDRYRAAARAVLEEEAKEIEEAA